jgi:hypothetical protein
MKRGDTRAELTVMRLLNRFGDVTLSEALQLLKEERNTIRKRGRQKKWDDFIAGDIYLMVHATIERGFGQIDSQHKIAEFLRLTPREIERGYKQGKAYMAKRPPTEVNDNIEVMFEEPKFAAYIASLKRPRK